MEEVGEWWNDAGAIVQCGPTTTRPRPRQRNGQSGIKESGHKQRKSYQKKNGTTFGDFSRSLMSGKKTYVSQNLGFLVRQWPNKNVENKLASSVDSIVISINSETIND